MRARFQHVREALLRLTAPLARLCEYLLVRWQLYLTLCLVLAALCLLPLLMLLVGLTWSPSWWWTLLTALAGLPVFLGAVYMVHPLPPSPGWKFSRQPLSPLGDAQVVLADTSLLTDGQREILIASPLEPTADLAKRPENTSLALAIAYTAELQNQETAAVLLGASAAMGASLDSLQQLRPVVGKTQLGPMPGVIVKDGKGQASYFVGDPVKLAALCDGIDGHQARAITKADRERIAAVTQVCREKGSLVLGFAVLESVQGAQGPIYLGSLSMRDVVSEDAQLAVEALLEAGYTLQTQPVDERYEPPMRLAALRQRLGLTAALYAPQVIVSTNIMNTHALCIAAVDRRHRRFDMPLLLAREWFGKVAAWLRLALGTALPLLIACALGPAHPLHCLGVLVLLTVGLSAAASDDRRWDIACLALLGVTCLLRGILLFVPSVPVGAAMGLYAVAAAWVISLHLPHRWQMIAACACLGPVMLALCWFLPGMPALGGLLALLLGLAAGVAAGQLLRRA